MNDQTIPTDAVISALSAMSEARAALSKTADNFPLAERIAVAEGRLRGALMAALPATVRTAA